MLSFVTAALAFNGPALRPAGAASVTMMAGKKAAPVAVVTQERSGALPWAPRPKNLDGTLTGDVGFDPAGFSDRISSIEELYRFREAELKHGRVCMLAVTGMLVQEVYSWPAPDDVFKAPTPLGALATVPGLGLAQIVLLLGIIEIQSAKYQGRVPGDVGFDPLGLSTNGINPFFAKAELEHGRLAMWATAAFLVQSLITNEPVLKTTMDWVASLPGSQL
ncbi:light harvesting complex protein 2 precursor [Pavlovales sp. CCMP2436]|nr:light harvesting complex protein 2 precursor [Pavlovales sp. CCMP2436]|mmetsp:Transcript_39470/g.92822  ORF Transcript_39470/g.92822 Transcript_39470/m.92822 type:complete len:220 (-) Transcript_39470:232-891(-)